MCTEVYSSYKSALSHQRQSNTYVHVLYFTNEMQDCHFWSEEKFEPLKKKKERKKKGKTGVEWRQTQTVSAMAKTIVWESWSHAYMHGGKLIKNVRHKTSYNSHTNVVISKVLLSGFTT